MNTKWRTLSWAAVFLLSCGGVPEEEKTGTCSITPSEFEVIAGETLTLVGTCPAVFFAPPYYEDGNTFANEFVWTAPSLEGEYTVEIRSSSGPNVVGQATARVIGQPTVQPTDTLWRTSAGQKFARFSPDGSLIASVTNRFANESIDAGSGGHLYFWDAETLAPTGTVDQLVTSAFAFHPTEPDRFALNLAWSYNVERSISGPLEWGRESGQIRRMFAPEIGASGLRYAPNGQLLVGWDESSGHLALFDVDAEQANLLLLPLGDSECPIIDGAAVCGAGGVWITTPATSTERRWTAISRPRDAWFSADSSELTLVTAAPRLTGENIAEALKAQELVTFDTATGAVLRRIGVDVDVIAVVRHPDGKRLVTLDKLLRVGLLDGVTGEVLFTSQRPTSIQLSGVPSGPGLRVSPNGKWVAVQSFTEETNGFRAHVSIAVLDLESESWLWREQEGHRLGDFSPDSATLLALPYDFQLQYRSGVLQLRNPEDGAVLATQVLPEADVRSARYSPEGDRIFWLSAADKGTNKAQAGGATGRNKSLLIVSDAQGQQLWSAYVGGAAWVPDDNGELVTSHVPNGGSPDGLLRYRDANTGEVIREETDPAQIEALRLMGGPDLERVSPDGTHTAVLNGDAGSVVTAGGTQILALKAEPGDFCTESCLTTIEATCRQACATTFKCVAWSPTGDRLALAEYGVESGFQIDGTTPVGNQQIRVLAFPSGQELQRLKVTDLGAGCNLDWHPKRDELLFAAEGEQMVLDVSPSRLGAGGCQPDGNYVGDWVQTGATGSCDPYNLDVNRAFWRITGQATSLEAFGFGFPGVLDQETCSATFQKTFDIDKLTFDFAFRAGAADATVTIERSQFGEICVTTYEGSLTLGGSLRPFHETEPVELGEQANVWAKAKGPDMVVAADGSAILTWTESNYYHETANDLVARVYDPGAGTLGVAVEVDDNDADVSRYELVGAPSANAVVAFRQPDARHVNGGFSSVFANVYTPGSGFSGSVPLENLALVDAGGLTDNADLWAAANDTATGFEAMVLFTYPERATLHTSRYVSGEWSAASEPAARWAELPGCGGLAEGLTSIPTLGAIADVAMNTAGDVAVLAVLECLTPGEDTLQFLQLNLAWFSAATGAWNLSTVATLSDPATAFNSFKHAEVVALRDGRILAVYVPFRDADGSVCSNIKATGPPEEFTGMLGQILDANGPVGAPMPIGGIEGLEYCEAKEIDVAVGPDGTAGVSWWINRSVDPEGQLIDSENRWAYSAFDGSAFATPSIIAGPELECCDPHDLALTSEGEALFTIAFRTQSAGLLRLPAGADSWSAIEDVLPAKIGLLPRLGTDDSGGALLMMRYERESNPNAADLTVIELQ